MICSSLSNENKNQNKIKNNLLNKKRKKSSIDSYTYSHSHSSQKSKDENSNQINFDSNQYIFDNKNGFEDKVKIINKKTLKNFLKKLIKIS
jgi:hypothetical protein